MRNRLCFLILVLNLTGLNAQRWVESQKLIAYDRGLYDSFGTYVEHEGNTMVVSAPAEDLPSPGSGSIVGDGALYVYNRNGNEWEFHQKIEVDRNLYRILGTSDMVLEGDKLACGAYSPGYQYVFILIFRQKADGFWYQECVIPTGFTLISGLSFANNQIILGSSDNSTDQNNTNTLSLAGALMVYEFDGTTNWNFKQKIVSPNRATNDRFGARIKSSGDYLAVTSYNEPVVGTSTFTQAGVVYIFKRDAFGNWQSTQRLISSDPGNNEGFGNAIRMKDSVLIIASPYDHHNEFGTDSIKQAGSMFEFQLQSNGTWLQTQKMTATLRQPFGHFGTYFDFDGDYLLSINYVMLNFLKRNQSGQWNFVNQSSSSDVTTYNNCFDITLSGDFALLGCSFGKETNYMNRVSMEGGMARVLWINGVRGNVYEDQNKDCSRGTYEPGSKYQRILIEPGSYVVETNENGDWATTLPAGTYTASVDTSGYWRPTCNNSVTFTVTTPGAALEVTPFAGLTKYPCSKPEVEVHLPILRPCRTGQHLTIKVSNGYQATLPIQGVYVELDKDSMLNITGATHTYTLTPEGRLRFDLPDMKPDTSIYITAYTDISCALQMGQTLCAQANFYPAEVCMLDTLPKDQPVGVSPCLTPWDKSSLKVSGWCGGDSIYFKVDNHGTGDMSCYAPVRIYVDGVMIQFDSILLISGESKIYAFLADGKTWHLEADQHPLHPGRSHPNATIERCGNLNNWTPGLYLDFALDDADPVVDIDCDVIRTSYDPNDKQVLPEGIGMEHAIQPNGTLNYKIRFQNTGNDTAFLIVIRDTIDQDLDLTSIKPGSASHSFQFRIKENRVVEWTFQNILLPDSTTNEPGSHGYLTYTIDQNRDLPNGTRILNTAAIYFDFNPPVITNTTDQEVNQCIRNQYRLSRNVKECSPFTDMDGLIHTSSFTETRTFQSILGCDSIMTSHYELTVPTSSSLNEVACNSYTAPDGQVFTASGQYTAIIPNAQSCDSIITINLTVKQTNASITETVCGSYTAPDGQIYNTSGTYQAVIPSTQGCDSTITINLSIANSVTSTLNETVCGSYTAPDGQVYTNSGTYLAVIPSTQGCDSTITINLIVNQPTTWTQSLSACGSYTFPDGQVVTNSDTYVHQYFTQAGCDSTVTSILTIDAEFTASITESSQSGEVQAVPSDGSSYEWYRCINSLENLNFNGSNYPNALMNDWLQVIIRRGACTDTSACTPVYPQSVHEQFANALKIAPNPTNGLVHISWDESQMQQELIITDMGGREIRRIQLLGKKAVDLELNEAPGMYFIHVIAIEGQHTVLPVIRN